MDISAETNAVSISTSTSLSRRERCSWQLTRVVGHFCLLAGTFFLLGWVFDWPLVRGDRSILFNMKANTAMATIVVAIGLIFAVRQARGGVVRWISPLCGVVVAVVGLVTLAQYVLGIDLGVDQLLVRESPGALGTSSPGRMGPPAAISFCLIGFALFLQDRSWRGFVLSQFLAAAGLLIAFLPFMGYVFQVATLYSTPGATGIALVTTILLLLMNLAIFTARPAQGIMVRVLSDDAGGYVIRQLLLPTILAPCVFGMVVRIGERQQWFSAAFGDAILVTLLVAFLTLVKLHRAGVLATLDRRRTQAEAEMGRQLSLTISANAEIVERDRRLQEVANTAAAMIWVADDQGMITFSNESFTIFAGSGAKSEIGSWLERIHEEDRTEFRRKFQTCFEKKEPFRGMARAGRADGQFRWLDVICQPRLNREGLFLGYVCTAQDVTESKEFSLQRESLLASERAARSQLEHAARMKDEFLATLSHELRTPLSAVLGWTQLLRRRDGNDAMLIEGLDTIERGARAQVQLIEDLLDLSRIASGKVRLNMHALELGTVINAAIEILRPSAETKRIRIVTEIGDNIPRLAGDPARLQQVIWNLLSNAIKFTPAGGEVRVSLSADAQNGQIEVAVQDNGQGIHPDFLPCVFDRFSQADSKPSRKHGGLGIGLALVKQIIELHGGSVRVVSPGVGRGATFTIRLPAEEAGQIPRTSALYTVAGNRPLPAEASFAGVSVLIVDDDAATRDVLARLLAQSEANAVVVESAEKALRRLEEKPPDLLISDIGMPDMDGFELMRRVRAAGHRLPGIALTAFARPEDRIACLKAGYDMHLAKPVDPRELLAVVASMTRVARSAMVKKNRPLLADGAEK